MFLVARQDGDAVGCGALVPIDEYSVEIKRMFVARESRGLGIATLILDELERLAREFDYDAMRLETGVKQPESIALYGKAGFYRIPNFPPRLRRRSLRRFALKRKFRNQQVQELQEFRSSERRLSALNDNYAKRSRFDSSELD